MSLQDYKGDSAVFKFTVSSKGIAEDITGWKILAEFGDDTGTELKKATSNVVGGGDGQVKITDAVNGKFEVYLDKGETNIFSNYGYLEVASLVGSDKDTLFFSELIFNTPKIDWETP